MQMPTTDVAQWIYAVSNLGFILHNIKPGLFNQCSLCQLKTQQKYGSIKHYDQFKTKQ